MLYLGLIKHPEICVHVHGLLLSSWFFVQFGRLTKFGLVTVNVSQEHHVVILSSFLPLLLPWYKNLTMYCWKKSFLWFGSNCVIATPFLNNNPWSFYVHVGTLFMKITWHYCIVPFFGNWQTSWGSYHYHLDLKQFPIYWPLWSEWAPNNGDPWSGWMLSWPCQSPAPPGPRVPVPPSPRLLPPDRPPCRHP